MSRARKPVKTADAGVALVPGRSCGACHACCEVVPIDTPELRKQSMTLCSFCRPGAGCAIYGRHPPVCRDWHCGWRMLPLLGEDWRPDLSGVMVTLEAELPEGFSEGPAVRLVLFRGPGPLRDPKVLGYLAGLVLGDVPAFLSVPGPAGFHPAKALVNAAMRRAAEARDGAAVMRIATEIHRLLEAGPFEPVVFG